MTRSRYVRRIVSRFEPCRVAESIEVEYGAQATTPEKVARIASAFLAGEAVEVFGALTLNAKQRVTGWIEVSRGTLTSSLVHPREVYGPALRIGDVAALIAVHNHPSGDPEPSQEDLAVTKRLAEAGRILGIELLDHLVVVEGGGYVGLRDRGLI